MYVQHSRRAVTQAVESQVALFVTSDRDTEKYENRTQPLTPGCDTGRVPAGFYDSSSRSDDADAGVGATLIYLELVWRSQGSH